MPNHRCALCAARGRSTQARDRSHACALCRESLADMLAEIAHRYTRLSAIPETTGDDGRKPSGFRSQSPARDHIIALRDQRSTAIIPGEPHSVLAVLSSWAQHVRATANHSPPTERRTVAREITLLLRWLDFITAHDWVDEFHEDLRALREQLRTATGEPPPKPVGHCITIIDTGEHTHECGARLYAPRYGSAIQCRHCGRVYDGLDLVRLELAQEHPQ